MPITPKTGSLFHAYSHEVIIVARQRRVSAGYRAADYALPAQVPPEVQALGHPRRGESIAGVFRRWLEAEGIIREGTI
jgi:hypothetical protein